MVMTQRGGNKLSIGAAGQLAINSTAGLWAFCMDVSLCPRAFSESHLARAVQ
jgi:hypothetical protein